MDVLRTISELRAWRRAARGKVALVPTMGYFHEGHLCLMRTARRAADVVLVSSFVNPIQFGPTEDLARYPRDLERDRALASDAGVDALFVPSAEEMYGQSHETFVYWPTMGNLLCGRTRPDHFRGVGTVVAKLFNLAFPHVATFGRKDGQQVLLLERMVRELNFDVEIVVCPTVREPDGLALSSRNALLSAADRIQALGIYAGLDAARAAILGGERRSAAIRNEMAQLMAKSPGLGVEYCEVVSRESLRAVDIIDHCSMIAVAGRVGTTRLLDNLWTMGADGDIRIEL
ncbi:pantoate--beta-alanine ligase [Candidatus Fermentibacteria bacterium]|nr:pantoate--beta-alanine ligase [Candidatus Fermentibacteria bacterium]